MDVSPTKPAENKMFMSPNNNQQLQNMNIRRPSRLMNMPFVIDNRRRSSSLPNETEINRIR